MAIQALKLSRVLFITYDGLLDPLGSSQILPYLKGIAAHPRKLYILSFEKPDRYEHAAQSLRTELDALGIGWTPLSFTSGLGKLGKLWDLLRMYTSAFSLHLQYKFEIIHCRSYQAMQVGCFIKRLFGSKTLFDMRGLWVDERMDGGIWDRGRGIDSIAFSAYKRIEARLLCCADHVIALTERVVPELRRLAPAMSAPVSVIPCCADFDHFGLPADARRRKVRAELGIPTEARVLAYLGSLGTWYMLDEMLRVFSDAQEKYGNVYLLLITRDWRAEHDALLSQMGLSSYRERIRVRSAGRNEVPELLGSADVMLSFIKPAYSKIASSPTKLAEAFALGVPVISNIGIGDVDEVTRQLDAGALVDLANPNSVKAVIEQLDTIVAKSGASLRQRARPALGLEVAQARYLQVYQSLESGL